MNKLTGAEIIEKFKKSGLPVEALADKYWLENFDIDDEEEQANVLNSLKEELGDWEQITQKGGEGQGDEWYIVNYFPAHDVYIRTDGWHTSYHGTDFDDGFGYEVKPQEKVITIYE
jgi:hypothetical protein